MLATKALWGGALAVTLHQKLKDAFTDFVVVFMDLKFLFNRLLLLFIGQHFVNITFVTGLLHGLMVDNDDEMIPDIIFE